MILKKDYEACFKEGFKLGTRLARAKINIMRASDAKRLGDEPMSEHHQEYAKTRKRPVAHAPNQPAIDLGDVELLDHKYGEPEKGEDEHQEVQVGGSGY
jgi:hypothetical protein